MHHDRIAQIVHASRRRRLLRRRTCARAQQHTWHPHAPQRSQLTTDRLDTCHAGKPHGPLPLPGRSVRRATRSLARAATSPPPRRCLWPNIRVVSWLRALAQAFPALASGPDRPSLPVTVAGPHRTCTGFRGPNVHSLASEYSGAIPKIKEVLRRSGPLTQRRRRRCATYCFNWASLAERNSLPGRHCGIAAAFATRYPITTNSLKSSTAPVRSQSGLMSSAGLWYAFVV